MNPEFADWHDIPNPAAMIAICKVEGAELSTPVKTQAEDSAPFIDDKIAYYLSLVNGKNGRAGGV